MKHNQETAVSLHEFYFPTALRCTPYKSNNISGYRPTHTIEIIWLVSAMAIYHT